MALVTDLEEDYQVSFKTLQDLRNLQDNIQIVSACLHASIGVIQDLINSEPRLSALDSSSSQLRGNLASVDSLRKRVQGILNLVSQLSHQRNHRSILISDAHCSAH